MSTSVTQEKNQTTRQKCSYGERERDFEEGLLVFTFFLWKRV